MIILKYPVDIEIYIRVNWVRVSSFTDKFLIDNLINDDMSFFHVCVQCAGKK